MSELPGSTEVCHQGDFQSLMQQLNELKEATRVERSRINDCNLETLSQDVEPLPPSAPVLSMKCRKTLKCTEEVFHLAWSPDKIHMVTGGQGGFAVIWDAFLGQKEYLIQTTSPWVTACSYAPSTTMVVCGGLDSQCSVYKLDGYKENGGATVTISEPTKRLSSHEKYITHCIFLGSDQQILSSSADSTCALWDMERDIPVRTFKGHRMEVAGLSVHPKDPFTVFATGSFDRSACLWDVRTGRCMKRLDQHESDVNAVRFLPTGDALGTTTNDGVVHLIDLRADQEIKSYTKPNIICGASALDFSKSGRVLFAAYDDHSIRAWDVVKGTQLFVLISHQGRISHIELSPDGTALGSSSWDGTTRVWA